MDAWTPNSFTKLKEPLPFEARRQAETAAHPTTPTPLKSSIPKNEASEWLEAAVQRAKEKYQEKRALEERLLQEEALKDKLASQFCRELFAWLEAIDVKFNSRFGSQVLAASTSGSEGDRSIKILASPLRSQERIAILNYQKDSKSLDLSVHAGCAAKPRQPIKLALTAEGVVVAQIGVEYFSAEQLGQKIVDDLLA